MEEIHLFILWENALEKKKEILEDIENNFEIINTYMIEWSKEKFSENLSRFYGTHLPEGSYKEQHCGNGPFMLITVKEKKPKYEVRTTTRGEEIVNVNMFDKKMYYRELTGGGHKVHATNSVEETNHDLTLLIGKNAEDYIKQYPKKGKTTILKQNLFGSNGWNSVEEMFYALNNCAEYAIMRNYETLPEEIYVNKHNDIDLICTSNIDVAYILNAKKVFKEDYRVHYVAKVKNKEAFFDLRYIGDGYYCNRLEENLLKNRIYNKKGFYTISDDEYYYTLMYHALLHKKEFAKDYKERLQKMKKNIIANTDKEYLEILQKWLIKNEYYVPIPVDISVLFNREKANQLSELVYRNEEKLVKLRDDLINIKIEKANIEKELNAMANSKSWKITKPIRDFRERASKQKKNKQVGGK